MKHKQLGFTIVEVIMVIAVTGVMLVAATRVLRGQTGETQFHQTMADIQSKIESSTDEVGKSYFPTASKYTCSLQAGTDNVKRATLAVDASGTTDHTGSNEQCLYLGKAIEVIKGSPTLYIYNVLGGRTYTDSAGNTKDATTLSQAQPEPAIANNTDLTETYTPIANGARLLSAHYDGSASTNTELASFYNDIAGSNAERERLSAKAYDFSATSSNPKNGLATCLEEKSACTNFAMNSWKLCYQDNSSKRTALLTVTSSSSGVVTKLDYVTCT